MRSHRTFMGRHRRMVAAVGTVILLATACGGDDDASPVTEPPARPDPTEAPADPVGDDEDADGSAGVPPPEFALDESPTVADGFRPVTARCEAEDERGAWLALAVPEGWELKGSGSAGSGSPLDESSTLEFETADGSVKVEVQPDRRGAEGELLDSEGEPWESFDYEWSSYGDSGEKSGTVTFEAIGTVDVADQQVELFVADRDQDADFLSATEHKARVDIAQLPNFALENRLHPVSAVIVVTHDPDAVALGADVVTSIVESLAIPACTRERVVGQLELTIGEDLDGDGHVTTMEDILGHELPSIEDLVDQD